MSEPDRLASVFGHGSRNALLAWLFVGVLILDAAGAFLRGQYEALLFSAVAIAIVILPAVLYWRPGIMPPWYFVGLISLPITWDAFSPIELGTPIVPSLAVATLGLLFVVELHKFTTLRLVPWFLVVLTVLLTLALAGLLNILRWSADVIVGTEFLLDGRSQDAINEAVMIELLFATIAGIVAGGLFFAYFTYVSPPRTEPPPRPAPIIELDTQELDARSLSERLGVSAVRQRQLSAGMQVVLGLMAGYGVWTQDIGVAVNAAGALAITFIPYLLERDFQIAAEPGLTLWVTSAVFLHTLGSWGLYGLIPPWDHLTHTLSATVVAAAGYTAIRGIDLHSRAVHLPPWAMFTFTIVFVMSMGVIWELLEFFVDELALMLGIDPVLAQHGIDDTIVDMIFNTLGAVIVATWGTVYLTEIAESVADQLERYIDPA